MAKNNWDNLRGVGIPIRSGEDDPYSKGMKRIGNLYEKVISIDNILLADAIARKGKAKQVGVMAFDRDWEQNIASIYGELATKSYRISPYKTKTIRERKERVISILPYRDRVVQHAIMNVLEPILVPTFTKDTYACIKGRGVHSALRYLKGCLKDVQGTGYCLKMDIRQFYPTIDRSVLKTPVRRKIKDIELLRLLDGIIDSAPGLPIGNYLSQYLSNLYLSAIDHYIKEKLDVKYYVRYADDMVILASNKQVLHMWLHDIKNYLETRLKLQLKGNYQVFPVPARGIDVLGYVLYHGHTLLRKTIKQNFARKVSKRIALQSLASYKGLAKHANCRNLIRKLEMKAFSELGIEQEYKLSGNKVGIQQVLNRQLTVMSFRIDNSKYPDLGNGKRLTIQVMVDNEERVIFTSSVILQDQLSKVNEEDFPFTATIVPLSPKGYKLT